MRKWLCLDHLKSNEIILGSNTVVLDYLPGAFTREHSVAKRAGRGQKSCIQVASASEFGPKSTCLEARQENERLEDPLCPLLLMTYDSFELLLPGSVAFSIEMPGA